MRLDGFVLWNCTDYTDERTDTKVNVAQITWSASAGARTRHHVWLEVHFTGADVGQCVMSQQRTGVHILLAYIVPPRAQFLMYHSSN